MIMELVVVGTVKVTVLVMFEVVVMNVLTFIVVS